MIEVKLNYRCEEPLSKQVYLQIKESISNGSARKDEKLPSIRILADNLNVSVITVKTAYDRLHIEGFIYTVKAKGCYIA